MLVTGNAIRVPTADVSLAIINANLKRDPGDKEAVNAFICEQAMAGPLQRQIDYSASNELASSDLVGNKFACVVDSKSTIVCTPKIVH